MTEQAKLFNSLSIKKFLKENSIDHVLSPRYYHQGNAIAEREIKTLINLLCRNIKEHHLWNDLVNFCVNVMNTSYHRSIQCFPCMLMKKKDRNEIYINDYLELKKKVYKVMMSERVKIDD